MDYARDPVAIASTKVSWTEGHASGFVPWSIFTYDESANKANPREVLFYQSFGLGPAAWRSIDEHPFPEATFADLRDAVCHSGRFDYLRYVEGAPARRETGNPEELSPVAEAEAMLTAAGLEIQREEEPGPGLRLVPEWESFISYEKHLELVEKDWAKAQRSALLRRAKRNCPDCAGDMELYGDGYSYYHRKDLAFVPCKSDDDHRFLKTKAVQAYTATAKSNYQLLRGTIDRYNRLNSSKRLIRSHSAFQKLVEMGPEAVPFILNDLRRGTVGGIWGAEVLAEIVGRRGGDPTWWTAWAKSNEFTLGEI